MPDRMLEILFASWQEGVSRLWHASEEMVGQRFNQIHAAGQPDHQELRCVVDCTCLKRADAIA
jgi:hypothetical protein